jgi:REP element-mobilizing transposase RayT
MANTYSQLYIQLVFTVKNNHLSLIKEAERPALEKYICGIVSNCKCKPLSIYCNPDHLHILVGLHPAVAISDLVRTIKSNSSGYLHRELSGYQTFGWQDGFGAFSYSRSQIDAVYKYIQNQAQHHKKFSFKEEYLDMLQKAGIDYDERYLFDWIIL